MRIEYTEMTLDKGVCSAFPELNNPECGSGAFSKVWRRTGRSTVLKMSADTSPRAFKTLIGRHFPRLVNDFGEVGAIRVKNYYGLPEKGFNNCRPLYLYEFELLECKPPDVDCFNLVDVVMDLGFGLEANELLEHVTQMPTNPLVSTSIMAAIKEVCRMAISNNFIIDLHDANVLFRGKEVVFADPFYDREMSILL